MNSEKAGIFLILCIVVPLIGALAGLQLKKMILKRRGRRISSEADKEDAVLLKFTKEEAQSLLQWEHETEFEYNGYMYDVIDTKVEGDTVSYWCRKDYKETEVNREVDEIIAFLLGKKHHKNKTQKRLTHFLKSLYFSRLPTAFFSIEQAGQFSSTVGSNYSSVFVSPAVPPPQLG